MNGVGVFFLLLLILAIILPALWIAYTRWRAHKNGLPPPLWSSYIPFRKNPADSNYPAAPRAGGVLGWFKDKWAALQSHRAGSGYAGARRGQRGFGPLDPDAAWDDRVDHEADTPYGGAAYEEQELGIHPPGHGRTDSGPYGMHGGGYAGSRNVLPEYGEDRGRTRSREDLSYIGGSQRGLDERYEETVHGQSSKGPYGGDGGGNGALRALSPRRHELHTTSTKSGQSGRHSMFREEI